MGLEQLTTEARNPAASEIDRSSSLEIVRLMNAEDAKVPPAIAAIAEPIAAAVDVVVDRMQSGGRLIYIGAGTSGRLGVLDASECPPTFNTPPWQVVGVIAGGPAALTRAIEGAEDYPDLAVQDLKKLSLAANDVVVGIATSGRTPYVIGGLKFANDVGAYTVGLACNEGSEIAAVAKLMLSPVVGPEVVTGSTRLKAGTATKLILNTLTTATMIRLGKTYGNLMVDLAATNLKLEDRSRRIVAALADVTPEKAAELLKQSHGDVKAAIVMQRKNVGEQQARVMLSQAGGQLRGALSQTPVESGTDRSSQTVSDRLVIGVDGGGTKTLAWIARLPPGIKEVGELTPLGEGEAGGSNPNSLGWAAALANIELSITRAFHAAGLQKQPAQAMCMGVAGAGRDAEQHRLRTWCDQRRLAERIIVTHDVSPLLSVPGMEGHGIALVAGTGSLAYGRTPDGRTARAGGFGYLLGDEGSGYRIAIEGLRAALRAVDGRGPETSMTRGFQSRLQVNSTAHFIHRFYEQAEDRTWIAGMASVVMAAAQAGDVVASEIVEQTIEDLATMVATVGVQLLGSAPSGYPLALAGGLIANSAYLRVGVLKRLEEGGLYAFESRHRDIAGGGDFAIGGPGRDRGRVPEVIVKGDRVMSGTSRPLLVLASRNLKKSGEIRDLLALYGFPLKSVAEFPQVGEVVEDGATFAENAAKKAREVAVASGQWAIGEDSGLRVDALDGAPGVYSARYSGEGATDEKNNLKLQEALKGIPADKRGAGYVCHVAVADPSGRVHLSFEDTCRGRMISEPRGENGFGYDPYFMVREYHQTFGQLSPMVKRYLSHRARAFRRLIPELIRLFERLGQ